MLRFLIPYLDFFREKKFGHQMLKNLSTVFSHILPRVKTYTVILPIFQSLLASLKVLDIKASDRVTFETCPLVFLFYSDAKGLGHKMNV
jgi:hypothetical protein